MEEEETQGMDTTYVGIMLVVFLVLAALAVDIGYLYVSEEDLHSAAGTSALAGAETLKKKLNEDLRSGQAASAADDTVQAAARAAAMEHAGGKHRAVALIDVLNDNSNRLTTSNDITVGFWNMSSQTYTPGGKPVNAMQVRTRRTAESEAVGLGSVGSILAVVSGVEKFNYTPEAIAALPARANTNVAFCSAACDSSCTYPNICSVPERKMSREPWHPGDRQSAADRYAYTSLLYHQSDNLKLSDMICMEMPAQEVCGKEIMTLLDRNDNPLRDMESMMYNPNIDAGNKEYDSTGTLRGWWVIAPVTDCPPADKTDTFERHRVTKYALVRISRICVPGTTGCKQNNTAFDAPTTVCSPDTNGLYIDRISCVNCGSKELLTFPGLHPVLVK